MGQVHVFEVQREISVAHEQRGRESTTRERHAHTTCTHRHIKNHKAMWQKGETAGWGRWLTEARRLDLKDDSV